MDKNDLAGLLVDASAEEVDQIHRLLHEWNVGPDGSFPVQLTLLTKAQWRIAATLPRLLNDSRKLTEQHLAEYRRQTKVMLDDFSSTTKQQQVEIKTAGEIHAKTIQQAAGQIQARLAEAEAVAKRVKSLMESAGAEWKEIKASTDIQCDRLQQISDDLQDRFAWRVIIWWAVGLLLALGYGILGGHYIWKH